MGKEIKAIIQRLIAQGYTKRAIAAAADVDPAVLSRFLNKDLSAQTESLLAFKKAERKLEKNQKK